MKGRFGFLAACACLALVAFVVAQQPQTGYTFVVSNLEYYQTETGGFHLNDNSAASLEATSHATFLSSLFGLKKKINPNEVARYLQTLENKEGGYGKTAGGSSDLESVRYAVLSYQHLGLPIPNSGNVATFVRSLLDAESNLFASRVGEKGDLKSTALALQVLDYLGELQRPWVEETFTPLRAFLQKHISADGSSFSFPASEKLSPVSANYYGIVCGAYAGFQFENPSKWADFIVALQTPEGGFRAGPSRQETSLEGTALAISSLRILSQLSKQDLVNLIDTDSLLSYALRIPADLRYAAHAHLAVAQTAAFQKNFESTISYEVLRAASNDKRVVQGTQMKPIISVKTHGTTPHPGLQIDAKVTFEASNQELTTKLQWKENQQYAATDFIDTKDKLGHVVFDYTVHSYVAGVGDLSFQLLDKRVVGYDVKVSPQARLEVTGKEFRVGETVPVGTDFTFGLTLQNQTQSDITSGDFEVRFTVLDSSEVAIHSEALPCKGNTRLISFAYSLKAANLPAGDLLFRFEVVASDKEIVHTVEDVVYRLGTPMIATRITFKGKEGQQQPSYKIGDNVQVTVEPAAFPDLRTVHALASKDFHDNDATAQRHFLMDISSPSGALLRSIQGKPSGSGYLFEVPVTPTLDAIGENVVSFRYVSAAGQSVRLSNYDSVLEELYEDSTLLKYTVSAELHLVNIRERPTTESFFYGNDITFRFQVKDAISGKLVEQGDNEQANVYLSLQHVDEEQAGATYTSTFEPASQGLNPQTEEPEFVIRWTINPNAVRGAGYLTISATDADGKQLTLLSEEDKKPFSTAVTIGGDIDVAHEAYTTSDFALDATAFIVNFNLSCQAKPLKDAQLRVSVSLLDGSNDASSRVLPASIAVATGGSSYSASWTVPHESAPTGNYRLNFFREVDRKRALDVKESQLKKKRREQELAGETPSVEELSEVEIEETLAPLFTITLHHDAPATSKLPIRTDLLVALLLGVVFFLVSYQKKQYQTKK
ncbi:hypothetical protein QOT17_000457 [Balamuthia mandrillaris]